LRSEEYIGRKFKTEFIGESFELEEGISEEFLKTCRILDLRGLAPGTTGNVSLRVDGGMLIKAGGKPLGRLTGDDIILVLEYDQKTNTAKVKGKFEPSSETPMHYLVYKNFPEVNAIVHAHDPLVLKNSELVERLKIKTTAREIPYGTLELAKEVIGRLKESRYVFIKNHGSIATGKNLKDAMDLMLQIHRKFEDEGKD